MVVKEAFLNKLETLARKFQKQAYRTRRDRTRKNVHQLRVTVRRIRAVLWLAEHGSPPLSFGKVKLALRDFGQALGKLRELDVAIQDAGQFHLDTSKLQKKRKAARRNLKRQMTTQQCLKIPSRIDDAIAKINGRRSLDISRGVFLLQKKILSWPHRTLKTGDDFHNLRIIIKKTRYALEAMGKPTRPLRGLQGILGKAHDLEILQNYLGANPVLRSEVTKQYKQARRLIRPTIRFAILQMKTVSSKTP